MSVSAAIHTIDIRAGANANATGSDTVRGDLRIQVGSLETLRLIRIIYRAADLQVYALLDEIEQRGKKR